MEDKESNSCEEIATHTQVNINEGCRCCSRFVPQHITSILLKMEFHDKNNTFQTIFWGYLWLPYPEILSCTILLRLWEEMNLTPCEEIASQVNIDERCGCCSRFFPQHITSIFLTMDWQDKKSAFETLF